MYPILIDFGSFDLPLLGPTHLFLPTYGVLFALGSLGAWWWFLVRVRPMGLPQEKAFNLTFYSLLSGILGAKLTLVAVEWRYYWERPFEILGTFRSAGVLLGGVLAAALVFFAYARRQGLPGFALADAAAAPLALGQAIGRLGCFAAGCCYGVPSQTGWCAVTFTDPAAAAQTGVPLGVPLVPTQLLQMGSDLLLALLLTGIYRRRPRPEGSVFWTYVLLYGLARIAIELWRGDRARGVYFGGHISTSQLFAAAGIVLASVMVVRGQVLGRRQRMA